ncbi:aromatic acid exporter family protein [Paenibacillus filicis]|uniref:Aromatic acid exporter family protein n=1 Tax=Paenibacillus gyeongsangnamensis TaxID=3388067 RepID=A0ABT4QH09_9BACL|nr:FUSC family protein [Paenibacillus filicis]MCZ8515980.1 aromatic acid exporter family protein [Paenibacillus filicis]
MSNGLKPNGRLVRWRRIHRFNMIWKAALAAGLSWDAAGLIGSKHPFFAPLAAILCLQITVEDSLTQALQRITGIVGGVFIADLFVRSMGVHDWSIALVVLLGMGLATWFNMGDKAVSQVGVTAVLILTVGPVGGDVTYGIDRIVETVVGALIAVLLNMFIVPPDFTRDAEENVRKAVSELAGRFQDAAGWLRTGAERDDLDAMKRKTRRLLEDIRAYQGHVNEAKKANKYSPLLRKRRTKLQRLGQQMTQLESAYVHALEMMELLEEWGNRVTLTEDDKAVWGERFMALADVLKEWNRRSAAGSDSINWIFAPISERREDQASSFRAALTLAAHQFWEDLVQGEPGGSQGKR